jgi:hypothetical protein
MASFFNPNEQLDPSKPQGDFSYQDQLRKIQLQQALAARMSQPLDKGGMVGGWYAGPSKAAGIASALQQALGGYLGVKASQNEAELNKQDRAEMRAARNDYFKSQDPSNFTAEAVEKNPMNVYTYKDPNAVGPTMDQLNGVQASPVMQSQLQAQPMPPVGQGAPAPLPAQAPPPAPVQGSDFNIDQAAAERIQGERVSYLTKAMQQKRADALDRLENTKSGGPLAQALYARDLAPGETKTFDVKNADGSTSVFGYDSKRGPGSVFKLALGQGDPTKAEDKAIERAEKVDKSQREWMGTATTATKNLGDTKQEVNTIDSSLTALNGARDALGKLKTGPYAQYFTKALAAIPGSETSGELKKLKAYFTSQAFQAAKATLVSNISDSDMKGFIASSPDESWAPEKIMEYMDNFERQANSRKTSLQETMGQYQQQLETANDKLGYKKGAISTGGGMPKGLDLFPPKN